MQVGDINSTSTAGYAFAALPFNTGHCYIISKRHLSIIVYSDNNWYRVTHQGQSSVEQLLASIYFGTDNFAGVAGLLDFLVF